MKIWSVILIGMLILSSPGIEAQNDSEENFQLTFMVFGENNLYSILASYINVVLQEIGINVQIEYVSWNQYVGNILSENEKSFDLTLIRFSQDEPFPSSNIYHSESNFGNRLYQLNDTDWNSFQETDIGISKQDIDEIINQIETLHDDELRSEISREFSELFMSQLLYDYPMVAKKSHLLINDGLNIDLFPDLPIFDLGQSLVNLRKLGYNWENAPNVRTNQVNSSTFQLDLTSANFPSNYNPYRMQNSIVRNLLSEPLINLDFNYTTHPGLALQWINHNSTENTDVVNDEHIFVLNPNFTFPSSNLFNGTHMVVYEEETLDAWDIIFSLEYLNTTSDPVINDMSDFISRISDITVSTTISQNDTLKILMNESLPDDFTNFNNIYALPEHILNNTLHFQNNSIIEAHNVFNSYFEASDSFEWQSWETHEGSSLLGNMEINSISSDTLHLDTREDYPFPRDYMIENYYQTGPSNLELLSTIYTSDRWAPHQDEKSIRYWDFDNSNTSNLIQYSGDIIFRSSTSRSDQIDLYENFQIDFLPLTLDEINFQTILPSGIIYEIVDKSSNYLLYFNLKNEHLQKRNVRYAIASMIDIEEVINFYPNSLVSAESPVAYYHSTFEYSNNISPFAEFSIPYNIETAIDLMQLEGYITNDLPPPTDTTIIQTTPNQNHDDEKRNPEDAPIEVPFYFSFSYFLVILVLIRPIRGKKKRKAVL